MAFKLPNIKEGMQKKYGTGEYTRGGKKFEERMKPGESKFKYDVRMKKETSKRAMGTDVETHDPKSEIKGTFGTAETYTNPAQPEPPVNPNDLRAPETTNFGVTDDMSFGKAFQQAKLGGIEYGGEFEWQGSPYVFEYEQPYKYLDEDHNLREDIHTGQIQKHVGGGKWEAK
jgi:hypothetical protein